jgi:hypothetical protein
MMLDADVVAASCPDPNLGTARMYKLPGEWSRRRTPGGFCLFFF